MVLEGKEGLLLCGAVCMTRAASRSSLGTQGKERETATATATATATGDYLSNLCDIYHQHFGHDRLMITGNCLRNAMDITSFSIALRE